MTKKVITVPATVERSSTDGPITYRNMDGESARNKALSSALQAEVNQSHKYSDTLNLPMIDNLDQLRAMLSELAMRFDTRPDYYTKKDYQLLIGALTGALTYLYNNSGSENDIAELLERLEDLQAELNDLKKDVGDISAEISNINETIFQILDRFDDYVPEEGFEDRVNELIEAALSDIPQPAPQKQIIYTEGSGIDISASDSDTMVVSAVLTEPITVSNVSIGGYSNGMTIDKDTPIVDVLKTILQKVVDVVAVEPSVKLTGTSQSVEYGSNVTSNLTINLTQGYFKPANNSWVADNQNMDYEITDVSPLTWTISTNGMSATASDTHEAVTTKTYSGYTVSVSEETTTIPKKSNGEDSSVRCDKSSLTASGSVTITPYYYLFFGPVDTSNITAVTSDTVRNLTRKKASFPLSNQTISETYNGGGKSILIACPTAYSLAAVTDAMGNSILELFKQQTRTLEIPCGNSTAVDYNLYLYPITNGADQAYKNLTFNLV